MKLKIICMRNTACAQAEHFGWMNIRIGNWFVAVGTERQWEVYRSIPAVQIPKSQMRPFVIEIMRPIMQSGMQTVFHVGCRFLSVAYTTKGETTPDHHRWEERGLHFFHRFRDIRIWARRKAVWGS